MIDARNIFLSIFCHTNKSDKTFRFSWYSLLKLWENIFFRKNSKGNWLVGENIPGKNVEENSSHFTKVWHRTSPVLSHLLNFYCLSLRSFKLVCNMYARSIRKLELKVDWLLRFEETLRKSWKWWEFSETKKVYEQE